MQNARSNAHGWNDETILSTKGLKEEIDIRSAGIPKSWNEFRDFVIIIIGKTINSMGPPMLVKTE